MLIDGAWAHGKRHLDDAAYVAAPTCDYDADLEPGIGV